MAPWDLVGCQKISNTAVSVLFLGPRTDTSMEPVSCPPYMTSGNDFRFWLPVSLPVRLPVKFPNINSDSPFRLWLPVMTSGRDFWLWLLVWLLVMTSNHDFQLLLPVWLPVWLQVMAKALQTLLDMEQEGSLCIRISCKMGILCETQLSAEDRSFWREMVE